jgi:hypothetical protein
MRLFEFADAKASLELWKLINDCVWKAISVQAQEQERIEQEHALKQKNKPKAAHKAKLPPKPTIASPQPSKAKKTSAQQIQQQKVQSKTVKSKPQTTSVPISSAVASVGKNQSNPSSINQTEKMLDPFSHSKTVKIFNN